MRTFDQRSTRKFRYGQLVLVTMFGGMQVLGNVREEEGQKVTVFDGSQKRIVKAEACSKFVPQ